MVRSYFRCGPQVSGIAALILSVNPGLTQQQVRDIIINTADKVGDNYIYTSGWNNEMGYGRVNAFNAVKAALPTTIAGPSLVCHLSTPYSIPGLPAGASVQWVSLTARYSYYQQPYG